MSLDIQQAKQEGYSDAEIADYLASKKNFDIAGARKEGYPDVEIISHLADQKERSTLEYLSSKVASGVVQMAALPAETVAAGGRLLRRGLSQIPGYTDVVPDLPMASPAQAVKQIIGVPELQPQNALERYGGAVAEFAGASLIPGAGIVSGAAHKLPAVAGLIGSSIGGGVGSEAGGDIAQATGLPRAVGQIPGGIAGAIYGGTPSTLFSKAKGLMGSQVGTQYAARELEKHVQAHPFVSDNISRAAEISQKITQAAGKPFNPTLGERTGATGVLALQTDLAGKSAMGVERAMAVRSGNVAALQAARESMFPKGLEVQRASSNLLTHIERTLDGKINQIEQLKRGVAETIPQHGQQLAGQKLLDLRKEAFQIAKGIKDRKLNDLYTSGRNVTIVTDDMAEATKAIIKDDMNTFQKLPGMLRETVSKWLPKEGETITLLGPQGKPLSTIAKTDPKPVTFDEFHSAWRETNRQLGQSIRSGDVQSSAFLSKLKVVLSNKLNSIEASGSNVAEKLRDFNRFYSTKYAPVFREGVGGKMVAEGRFGEQMKTENIVKAFFNPSGMDDFAAIYGQNPQAQQALKDGVLGMFARSAIKDGAINVKSAQNFITRNNETLNRLPDIKNLLSNRTLVTEALVERNARLIASQKQIDRTALVNITKTNDITEFVTKNIKDPRTLMQILSLPGTARDTALRAIADAIPQAAAKAGVSPVQYLAQNEAILKPLLNRMGPQHYENLKTLSGAMEIMGRWKVPTSPDPRQLLKDPLEAAIGTTIPSAISQFRATTITRQSSPIYMLTSMGTKFLNKLRQGGGDRIIEEAFYDPAVAAALREGLQTGIVSNRLRDQLISYGVVSAAVADR